MGSFVLGFVFDMSNDDYHSYGGISKSGLDKISRSPAHYKYGARKEATRPMAVGTAIHTAILEPERFAAEYCITEAKARTEKAYKGKKAIYGGDFTLTANEGSKIEGMKKSVRLNNQACKLLDGDGNAEVSAICKDPETGVIIRARYDWLTHDRVAVDLKKTQDIRPHKFARSVNDYRYHVQDAMYSFIYKQITGDDLHEFYFLAVEEEPPYSCKLYRLDDLAKEMGAFYFRRDLRTYADCLDSGVWPHPNSGDGIIELNNWAVSQYEEDIEVII